MALGSFSSFFIAVCYSHVFHDISYTLCVLIDTHYAPHLSSNSQIVQQNFSFSLCRSLPVARVPTSPFPRVPMSPFCVSPVQELSGKVDAEFDIVGAAHGVLLLAVPGRQVQWVCVARAGGDVPHRTHFGRRVGNGCQ